jgi:hypothetical protein
LDARARCVTAAGFARGVRTPVLPPESGAGVPLEGSGCAPTAGALAAMDRPKGGWPPDAHCSKTPMPSLRETHSVFHSDRPGQVAPAAIDPVGRWTGLVRAARRDGGNGPGQPWTLPQEGF